MKHPICTLLRRASAVALTLGLTCAPLRAVDEDEWYDPTDWFDGNNIESDDTLGPYGYTYDFEIGDDWTDYDTWGVDMWEPDYYDEEYWNDMEWDNSGTTTASSTPSRSSSGPQSKTDQAAGTGTGKSSATGRDDAIVYTYVLFYEPVAQQARSGSTTEGQQSKASAKPARLTGTIEGLRTMNLKRQSGATGNHTIAKIKLENGKTTVVSLGRSSQLEKLNLKKGDKVEAVGHRGMIDGETVFVAHKLKAGGQTIAANPAIRLNRGQKEQAQSSGANNKAGAMTGSAGSGTEEIRGEVEKVSYSALETKNRHTLIDIKLEDGTTKTVDLGPGASLEKIDLEEGDEITVRGRTRQMNGRTVLVPDLLRVDGEKVSVKR